MMASSPATAWGTRRCGSADVSYLLDSSGHAIRSGLLDAGPPAALKEDMIRTGVVLVTLLILAAGTARADAIWPEPGFAEPIAIGIQLPALALGAIDLSTQAHGKTYGGIELAVGGTAAAYNVWFAVQFAQQDGTFGEHYVAGTLAGLAVVDLAIAAHGLYLARRSDAGETPTFVVGSVRASIAPSVVSDGKVAAPALGLGGTF